MDDITAKKILGECGWGSAIISCDNEAAKMKERLQQKLKEKQAAAAPEPPAAKKKKKKKKPPQAIPQTESDNSEPVKA